MESTQDQVLIALRQIMRAVDLHSRQLLHSHKLTGPQALILRVIKRSGELTLGQLARKVSLSPATLSDVINRLEARGLARRVRSTQDKRQVLVSLTPTGLELLAEDVPLLQDRFVERFSCLQDWEQMLLLSSLQRIASMMDASDIDAAPVLSAGPLTAAPLYPADCQIHDQKTRVTK
ncbi:MAG: MarR family transcriptional regulator [Gammaproteobacteria bacterium SHHR-1]|uniref:MarR family winged helix-turn-helix transcriptional regulator n=1 Tax=Magnetovirga frankeli TaxID=947516 RepID=UPI001293C27A|nr:MarR family transcriptional regulator [gamma proteobacterium SS-5]